MTNARCIAPWFAVIAFFGCGPQTEADQPAPTTAVTGKVVEPTPTATTTATTTADETPTTTTTTTTTTTCSGPAPSPKHKCMQLCGPPVSQVGDPPVGWKWMSPEEADNREKFGCPKCLPPTTRIATPNGEVAIEDLREGDLVLSTDERGQTVSVPIERLIAVPAPAHSVLRVRLSDGREVAASVDHPVANGEPMSSLAVGGMLDGASIVAVQLVPLEQDRTMDLLPRSPSGTYFANGVLLKSTLKRK